jgi:pantoate--beta-alanine ligase
MGALHAGHAALMDAARRECETVVVTIFVNPLQFDRSDDLQRYPRTLSADIDVCARLAIDLVFAPDVDEMYPQPPACAVTVGSLADHLCGRFRPGHFQGVATVVLKLLQIATPDRAYFGEKDAQQLAIIRRMVADFNLPVDIVGVPTVREPDGLALSSRNVHLSERQRPLALSLSRLLESARHLIGDAGMTDSGEIKAAVQRQLPTDPDVRLEYFEIVTPDTLQPVTTIAGPVLVAGAMWVGSTRLIDNVSVAPRSVKPS